MTAKHFLFFLVLSPLLASLGHDIYMFIENQEKGFMLSAVGFLWTTYHPESYKWVNENVDGQSWALINMVLAQKSVVVFGGFAAIVFALSWALSLLTKVKTPKSGRDVDFLNKNKKGGYKFKRK